MGTLNRPAALNLFSRVPISVFSLPSTLLGFSSLFSQGAASSGWSRVHTNPLASQENCFCLLCRHLRLAFGSAEIIGVSDPWAQRLRATSGIYISFQSQRLVPALPAVRPVGISVWNWVPECHIQHRAVSPASLSVFLRTRTQQRNWKVLCELDQTGATGLFGDLTRAL